MHDSVRQGSLDLQKKALKIGKHTVLEIALLKAKKARSSMKL